MLVIDRNAHPGTYSEELDRTLSDIGLTREEMDTLLELDFEVVEHQPHLQFHNDEGELWTTRIGLGMVEVSDSILYPPAGREKDNTGIHLKVGERGGFEIILCLEGEMTLALPQTVEPVAPGVYVSTSGVDEVTVRPGQMAIIPAPTANGWLRVSEGAVFRYVCQPLWEEENIRPVYDV